MRSLSEIARALGGEVSGRRVLAPGPNHSPRDRSLSIELSRTASLGFVVWSFAGDSWESCKDHVADRLGISREHAPKRIDPVERLRERARQAEAEHAERRGRIKRAQTLWNSGSDPRGTLVETYLRSRLIDLTDDVAMSTIRFVPACSWADETTGGLVHVPAMVTAMRNIETNEVTAAHRTALTPEGLKVGRRMLGIAAGAAIKLDPDQAVTDELVIGEGIETALSGRQLGYRPAWAMGSVLSVAGFPVLTDVRRLLVLEEIDESGASARAIAQVAARWTGARREVFAIRPTIGRDLNDAIRGIA